MSGYRAGSRDAGDVPARGGLTGLRRRAPRVIAIVFAAILVTGCDGPDGTVLSLPAQETVRADFVDGRPVFVVRRDDGAVSVLDALDPHRVPEFDFQPILAWCKDSRRFEDLWFGSSFDPSGDYLGGPAPTGMAPYEVVEVTEDSVVVGTRGEPPPRPPPNEHDPGGTACDQRTSTYALGRVEVDPSILNDLVVHDVPTDAPSGWWFPTPARILGQEPVVPSDWPSR